MLLFWDTSAVVPLIFQEPHTPKARRARAATTRALAWRWMQLEAEAALLRRNATPTQWEALQTLLSRFTWLDMSAGQLSELRHFNKALALRALDAAHVYICSKAHSAEPRIRLVTFDREMTKAARQCALPRWTP